MGLTEILAVGTSLLALAAYELRLVWLVDRRPHSVARLAHGEIRARWVLALEKHPGSATDAGGDARAARRARAIRPGTARAAGPVVPARAALRTLPDPAPVSGLSWKTRDGRLLRGPQPAVLLRPQTRSGQTQNGGPKAKAQAFGLLAVPRTSTEAEKRQYRENDDDQADDVDDAVHEGFLSSR